MDDVSVAVFSSAYWRWTPDFDFDFDELLDPVWSPLSRVSVFTTITSRGAYHAATKIEQWCLSRTSATFGGAYPLHCSLNATSETDRGVINALSESRTLWDRMPSAPRLVVVLPNPRRLDFWERVVEVIKDTGYPCVLYAPDKEKP